MGMMEGVDSVESSQMLYGTEQKQGGRRRKPVMTMGGAASNQGKNQLRQ